MLLHLLHFLHFHFPVFDSVNYLSPLHISPLERNAIVIIMEACGFSIRCKKEINYGTYYQVVVVM